MKTKQILTVLLLAVAGCLLAGWYFHQRPAAEAVTQPVVAKVSQPAPALNPAQQQPSEPAVVVPEVVTDEPAVATAPAPIAKVAKPHKHASPGSSAKAKDPIQDPDAREALSFVGADPEAEAYWESAINDPNLSSQERQDLIEDLNEDGLSDPKHPAPEDMPLILNRLALIEELAPDAMDKVNADAFAEAHKDLVAMLNGESVH